MWLSVFQSTNTPRQHLNGRCRRHRSLNAITWRVLLSMLQVEVGDLPAYKAFHADVLGTAPHVRSITSYMVMGTPKDLRD